MLASNCPRVSTSASRCRAACLRPPLPSRAKIADTESMAISRMRRSRRGRRLREAISLTPLLAVALHDRFESALGLQRGDSLIDPLQRFGAVGTTLAKDQMVLQPAQWLRQNDDVVRRNTSLGLG